MHIANLHSSGYFSFCGIIIPPDKTVCLFPVLSRGIISEYALLLAFIVGVGSVLYNGNLADAIRSVFSNVNTLIEEAGRYEGLADELQGKPSKTLEITSDSPEGQKLAKKLNIQMKQGDAWFARVLKQWWQHCKLGRHLL